jgi:hypothetical protein
LKQGAENFIGFFGGRWFMGFGGISRFLDTDSITTNVAILYGFIPMADAANAR